MATKWGKTLQGNTVTTVEGNDIFAAKQDDGQWLVTCTESNNDFHYSHADTRTRALEDVLDSIKGV